VPPNISRTRDLSPPPQDRHPQVDLDRQTIRGVKVCGLVSRSGRRYPVEVLQEALPLYQGAPLNDSHLRTGEKFRGYSDRMGWIENPRLEADGIYADVRYNPEHGKAKSLVWWAQNNPRAVGLSHDITFEKDFGPQGEIIVRKIHSVIGVDLVADPNTNDGLREAMDDTAIAPSTPEPGEDGYEAYIGKAITAIVMDKALSAGEKKKKVLAALKLLDDAAEPAPENKPNPGADSNSDTGEAKEAMIAAAVEKAIGKGMAGFSASVDRLVEAMAAKPSAELKPAPKIVAAAREAIDVTEPVTSNGKPKAAPPTKDLVSAIRSQSQW
jgi:hypothetical protein